MTKHEAFAQWHTESHDPHRDWSAEQLFHAGWDAREAAGVQLIGWSDPALANVIWALWPVKKARGAAIPAITKAIKKAGFETIKTAVTAYADALATWKPEDRQFIPMCSTWMNQERWLDDRSTWQRGTPATSQFSKSYR